MNAIDHTMVYLNRNWQVNSIVLLEISSYSDNRYRPILFVIRMNKRCKAKPGDVSDKKSVFLSFIWAVRTFSYFFYDCIRVLKIFFEIIIIAPEVKKNLSTMPVKNPVRRNSRDRNVSTAAPVTLRNMKEKTQCSKGTSDTGNNNKSKCPRSVEEEAYHLANLYVQASQIICICFYAADNIAYILERSQTDYDCILFIQIRKSV